VNINDLDRLPNENYYQYVWGIDGLIRQGKYKNWDEVTPIVNKQVSDDEVKGESGHRKPCKYVRDFIEAGVFNNFDEDEYLKELQVQKREVEKEKVKLQTEKLEYSRWLREEARDELITEKIIEAIKSLPPLSVPEVLPVVHNSKYGCLIYGDEHFAVEFEILGLFGEILNSYSPEIFKERMWNLLNQTVEIIKKEGLTKIHAFSMGDFTDGILRVGQLFKLRYGVVQGTVIYADFICNWLNKLTEYVNVEFQMVHGNHSELRMLGQPKGTFKDDNMGLIVYESIKTRLENNPNFTIVKNPTGLIFANVAGFNILGIHGEVKNMENALKDFSNTYKTQIDYLLAGHLHHARSETVGVNREVINVPSVIGVDTFSMSLNKTSNAGATFMVLEESKGKTIEYSIKLN
jgi:predicted phosphodiesterase